MRDEVLQANLRAIAHLPDMVKLSLVSGHIFCLFILTREVFSCHYPATPFKSSVLWRRVKSPWQWYELTCTARRNPTFQIPGQRRTFLYWNENVWFLKNTQVKMFKISWEQCNVNIHRKSVRKACEPSGNTDTDLHHSAGQDFIIFSHQRWNILPVYKESSSVGLFWLFFFLGWLP